MEKILNQILEKLNSIESDIKDLKQSQNRIEQKLDSVHNQTADLTNNLDFVNIAIDVIKDTTGSHEMDIKILKRLRNNHSL